MSAVPVVTIYKNGDLHFFGKKLVVNVKRISTFDNFLDKVTQDTHARVAIRRLCTPNHGSRVVKLEQLQNGGIYVAVGQEKFKRLQYGKLQPIHQQKIMKQNVKPVLHSRLHASARYKKVALAEPLQNRIVYVHRNGEPKHPGLKLLLDKRILQSMDTVLQYISNKIKLRTGAVRCLVTMDGIEVKETKNIKTGTRYVAVGYNRPLIKAVYENGQNSFNVTPKRSTLPKNSSKNKCDKVVFRRGCKAYLKQGNNENEDNSKPCYYENTIDESGADGNCTGNFMPCLTNEITNELDKSRTNEAILKDDNIVEGVVDIFEGKVDDGENDASISAFNDAENDGEIDRKNDSEIEACSHVENVVRNATFNKNKNRNDKKGRKKILKGFGTSYSKHITKDTVSSKKLSTNSDSLSNSYSKAEGHDATLSSDTEGKFDLFEEDDKNVATPTVKPVSNDIAIEVLTSDQNNPVHSGKYKHRDKQPSLIEDEPTERETTVGPISPSFTATHMKEIYKTQRELRNTKSPNVFDASGTQGEIAEPVTDNQETAVEQTIDQQLAEEVTDEEVKGGNVAAEDHLTTSEIDLNKTEAKTSNHEMQ